MMALEGIRVLEVSQTPIASFCTMMLGDFGAEVVRVEAPPSRPGAEIYASPRGEENRRIAAHYALHRNKKNICLRETFLTKTSDEWFEQLSQKNIPIAKVNDMDDVSCDPHVIHRKMVVEVDDPKVGKVKQIGIPIKLSERR